MLQQLPILKEHASKSLTSYRIFRTLLPDWNGSRADTMPPANRAASAAFLFSGQRHQPCLLRLLG